MKNTRKFAAMAAALSLAVCSIAPITMSASAAANTISFTGEAGDGTGITHQYTAYKIFSGTIEEGVLTGIEWAKGDEAADDFLSALKADDTTITISDTETTTLKALFGDCTTAASVAKVLAGYNDDTAVVQAFATLAGSKLDSFTKVNEQASTTIDVETSGDGYYLIVDESMGSADNKDFAKSRYLLAQVDASEGLEISVKSSLPTVEKKVKENTHTITYGTEANETEDYVGTGYNDVADYCIGDTVPFSLYGTIPSTIDDYVKYNYIFHDTLSTGLTLDDDSIKVTIGSATVDPDCYKYAAGSDGAFTITFDDIKSVKADDGQSEEKNGDAITVNADTVVRVDYNATLNGNAVIGLDGNPNEVYLEYSNNPEWDGTGTSDTGETPKDTVIVFTYQMDVTKYLNSKDKTANDQDGTKAGFKLYKTVGEKAYVATVDTTTGKITGWEESVVENEVETKGTEVTTASDGTFKFVGLDNGTYTLKETTVPDGYNKMDDMTITVKATTANNQDWDSFKASDALTALVINDGTADITGVPNTGSATVEIINKSGSTLPGTGGIGTKIFYVGGGCMVAVAGIFLITKKRMNKKEN